MSVPLIVPSWSVPKQIKAYSTTRVGGASCGDYDSFNLAYHVGDQADRVTANHKILQQTLTLPKPPIWLQQVHGSRVVELGRDHDLRADAAVCFEPDIVAAILTADCLPVLLCGRDADCVGLVHAGWRGMVAGIIEATVQAMRCPAADLSAWLGPGIGPHAYRVGNEVRDAFVREDEELALAFLPDNVGSWMMNLYEIAALKLTRLGVLAVTGGDFCTYTDAPRFYSFRRDGVTGRMAHLIWISSKDN